MFEQLQSLLHINSGIHYQQGFCKRIRTCIITVKAKKSATRRCFNKNWRMTVKTLIREDLLSLSISERIQLVQDLWDSIIEGPEQLPLNDEQKTELDRRMHNYQKNPEPGDSWHIVKNRIKSKK